jgi:DNA-binding XRE family transcriptional regulator
MAPCWTFIEISCPLPKDKRLLPDEIRRKLKKGDTRIVRKGYLAQLLGRTEIISSEAVEGSFRRLDPITGKEEYARVYEFDLHLGMLQFLGRIRPRQTQVLPTRILALDPVRQSVEKRLAKFLVWMWRVNWRKPEPKPFLVRTLIKEGGIGEITRYNTTQKKITKLEKALDCLEEEGIIPGWQYDHTDFDSAKDPLEKKILIEAPDRIYQIYERIAPDVPRLALPEPSGDPVEDDSPLGVRLKAWRRERRLTQLQMAEKLGISQGMLALVESGTKKPGKALANKIKSLLSQ